MVDKLYTLPDSQGNLIQITVRKDGRLHKSARWQEKPEGVYLLRVPARLRNRDIDRLVADVIQQIENGHEKKARLAARRNDPALHLRASRINEQYFKGEIEWQAIRWVGNMNSRLGSCTNGGLTDGHIRISNKMKNWPDWVIDYVVAHELAHRKHSDHSKAFWDYLRDSYPLTEQARGFIKGVGFAKGIDLGEDEE